MAVLPVQFSSVPTYSFHPLRASGFSLNASMKLIPVPLTPYSIPQFWVGRDRWARRLFPHDPGGSSGPTLPVPSIFGCWTHPPIAPIASQPNGNAPFPLPALANASIGGAFWRAGFHPGLVVRDCDAPHLCRRILVPLTSSIPQEFPAGRRCRARRLLRRSVNQGCAFPC